jgi:predicted amidohydrolase
MTTETLRVAAVQLQSQDDVAQNLEECRRLVMAAAQDGAKLVVLPENFSYFGADETKHQIAERLSEGPIHAALSDLARRAQVHLVAGGYPQASADPKRPFNTALVFGPSGLLVTSYRKIHLFDVALQDGTSLSESSGTTGGSVDSLACFDIGSFRIGVSICYDLRFPELYRALVSQGANVLLVPAAFTLHTGKDHWHPLLRARAIESQAYVVAAGQWGKHPRGRTTYGHSLVADPWGTVIAEASDQVGFVCATLDYAYLERVRAAIPCLHNRRMP